MAEAAAFGKTAKNMPDEMHNDWFCPVAVETFGPIYSDGHIFITAIGRRASAIISDQREIAFLYQTSPLLSNT